MEWKKREDGVFAHNVMDQGTQKTSQIELDVQNPLRRTAPGK